MTQAYTSYEAACAEGSLVDGGASMFLARLGEAVEHAREEAQSEVRAHHCKAQEHHREASCLAQQNERGCGDELADDDEAKPPLPRLGPPENGEARHGCERKQEGQPGERGGWTYGIEPWRAVVADECKRAVRDMRLDLFRIDGAHRGEEYSSYMLAYGSVIYNDILAPFRRKGISERRGLLWNRLIVAALGIFFLFYGLWYPLKGPLWTYLTVTATICFSSMMALLVSCCYWKRANDWGALGAIIFGAVIPVTYLVMEQVPATAEIAKWIGPNWSGTATFVLSGLAMVVGSLLKPSAGATQTVAAEMEGRSA